MNWLRAHWLPVVRRTVDFLIIAIQCCLLTFRDEAVAKGGLLLLLLIAITTICVRHFTEVI